MQRSSTAASLPQRIHLVGIGGIGLSAIARVLALRGHQVSGSDMRASALTDELERLGVRVTIGHAAAHISGAELVIISSAVPEGNPEVLAAREAGIPVLKRQQMLGAMLRDAFGIAVAGTHGKTTTSAMLAVMLAGLGLEPSYIVGGVIANLGSNAGAGRGRHFVIEADEYDRAFLGLCPDVAVVTNLEMDHPDCFPTLGDMQQAFAEFLVQVKPGGYVVACGDSPALGQVLRGLNRQHVHLVTYGCDRANDVWVRDITGLDGDMTFALWRSGALWQRGCLAVPGVHNALNAAAALIVADICGLDVAAAATELETFQGTARRFQLKGEVRGVTVIDDYAHHPTEVRATLAAARLRYPGRRLWAVLQPHTFSRLEALFDEFATCFDDADRVIVTDVYAARAKEQPTVRASDLVAAMRHPAAEHVASLDQVVDHLLPQLCAGDVLITLGAGDGYLIGERVLKQLADDRHG